MYVVESASCQSFSVLPSPLRRSRLRRRYLQKRVVPHFFLCLSRACLGKKMAFLV
eukprot:COSAG06_NODE_855_length_11931_cov_20.218813_1_plen_55_part_00